MPNTNSELKSLAFSFWKTEALDWSTSPQLARKCNNVRFAIFISGKMLVAVLFGTIQIWRSSCCYSEDHLFWRQ